MDVLIAFGLAINDALIGDMTSLKWVQSLATGVDHFLRCPSLKAETILTSARGIHGPPMRESVARMMLSLVFGSEAKHRNQEIGKWDRGSPWHLLAGKTAIVAGTGVSGSAIAELLTAFGMTVIGLSRTPRPIAGFARIEAMSQLARIAPEADWLINVMPGSTENESLFDTTVFTAMSRHAYFVNVGRGETVDEEALLEALRTQRIAGAALDAFRQEPLPATHPFWAMPNVHVTPHVAGYVAEYEALVMPIIERNMGKFLNGDGVSMDNIIARQTSELRT